MNIQETIALIEALRSSGVLKFKSAEHEIELKVDVPHGTPQKTIIPPSLPSVDKESEVVATEKLKNLINTINMSPEELANKMFPDGAL